MGKQKNSATFNGKRTRTHSSWTAMRTRCMNSKCAMYPHYGGRGITICARWDDYGAFLADMGERPPGLTLDRYPNSDGNYEPGNCRWATPIEQRNNRRDNRHITYRGETMTIAEAARKYGINRGTLYSRLFELGFSIERALTESCDINGENAPFAKLTKAQALAILQSTDSSAVLSTRYGVSRVTVWSIRAGKKWRCLQESALDQREAALAKVSA